MSTTALKRPLAEAQADAEAFRDLFAECYERWTIAGSVRRGKSEVGDVEHVVIPTQRDRIIPGSMFGEMESVNALLVRMDELLDAGVLVKHTYDVNRADGTTGERQMWGDKYRGIDFRGHMHEVFCATPAGWGAILAIRTGPADFSKRLVTSLHPRGLQCEGGRVKYKRDGKVYATPTEESFFVACGVPWLEPKERR